MRGNRQNRVRKAESGAALLIAIFALLLISVVAIALVVSSGTDAALSGNYRTSTGAYFASVAGLEEARSRLLWKNPDCLVTRLLSPPNPPCPNAAFIPTVGFLPAMQLHDVRYILNPLNGETVDPLSANPADYPDTEYATEFAPLAGANVLTIPSVWQTNASGLPGPQYKWARITPATEKSLNIDVNGDGVKDALTRLYYEPANLDSFCRPRPGLIPEGAPVLVSCSPAEQLLSPTPAGVQALEITSLAVLPNGARRMMQYVVAPLVISAVVPLGTPLPPGMPSNNYPAALTLDGSSVTFQSPNPTGNPNDCTPGSPGAAYCIDGQDYSNTANGVAAISCTIPSGCSPITAEISSQGPTNPNFYPGSPINPASTPPNAPTFAPGSVVNLSVPQPPPQPLLQQRWQTPKALDAIAQDITDSADVVINKPAATGSDISARAPTMSATNPMTIVVNGDLDLNGWHNSGFGLLLITGTLHYDPDASWNGIVLVIGKGIFSSSKNGSGVIHGAVLVAKTRDNSGVLLTTPTLGPAFFGTQSSYGSGPGLGIRYDSFWTQQAQGPLTYKVLSFREIPLAN